MDAVIYNKIEKEREIIINAVAAYSGSLSTALIFVGDYTNEEVNKSYGSIDKYHRRIVAT